MCYRWPVSLFRLQGQGGTSKQAHCGINATAASALMPPVGSRRPAHGGLQLLSFQIKARPRVGCACEERKEFSRGRLAANLSKFPTMTMLKSVPEMRMLAFDVQLSGGFKESRWLVVNVPHARIRW
jgi:hypothetical protein